MIKERIRMNYLKVETFLKIIETGSINKAADELYTSQSTVSNRLISLEEEIGSVLIQRKQGTRSIELTEAGIQFMVYAHRLIELNKEVEEWKSGSQRMKVNIAAPVSVNSYFFKTFFMKQLTSEQYHINISSQWNHNTYQMLQNYELDIGFVSTPFFLNSVETLELYSEPMVVIYDRDHSNYQGFEIKNLKVDDEIHLGWGPDYENWHNSLWSATEHPLTSVDSPNLILEFLKTPHSWAAVPLVIYDQFKILNPSIKAFNSKKMFNRKIYLARRQSENLIYINKINHFLLELQDYLEYMETAGFCELS